MTFSPLAVAAESSRPIPHGTTEQALDKTARRPLNLSINGFRGLCALLVFGFHVVNARFFSFTDHSQPIESLIYFLRSFSYGVEMFFMISGFVIVDSLQRHASIGKFLFDRFLRIFPLWIPVFFCICLIDLAGSIGIFKGPASPFERLGLVISNLLLLDPILGAPAAHTASWTLTYEWIFYLLAAAAGFAFRRRYGWLVSSALWFLPVVALINSFPRGLFFLPGVALALHPEPFRRLPVGLLPWVSMLLFWLSWRYVETAGGFHVKVGDPELTIIEWIGPGGHLSMVGCALLALLAGAVMFSDIALERGSLAAMMRWPLFQYLGTISFSFYLWHPMVMFPVKNLVNRFITPTLGPATGLIVFALVSLAIAVPLSRLSWALFERRFSSVLRKLAAPSTGTQH